VRRSLIPLLALAAGCAIAMGPPKTEVEGLVVSLFNGAGRGAGTVTLEAQEDQVLLFIFDVRGLPPGRHATHLHAIGNCTRPDFLSAGPHYDEGRHQHGHDNPAGPHRGDLGDIVVDAAGNSRDTLRLAPLDGRLDLGALVGGDGSAIVIHADPDDERTDPHGNSGVRIACGILV
jgi:Cu-Zn family superoxide dismutase